MESPIFVLVQVTVLVVDLNCFTYELEMNNKHASFWLFPILFGFPFYANL